MDKTPSFDGRNGNKVSNGRERSESFQGGFTRGQVLNPKEGAGKYHLILTLSEM